MGINICVNCMEEMKEGEIICPRCHFNNADEVQQPAYAMPIGSILYGRYLIGRVLGRGGFGITYLGYDLKLKIKVAIKEFYPSSLASRQYSGVNVIWNDSVYSETQRKKGCESFLSEARRMASLDLIPSVVRVRDTFQDNNTAYIVMDYVQGITLKKYVQTKGPMQVEACVRMFAPLFDSIGKLHTIGIVHRDISPDNIMIEENGTVWLLDLGAAKDINVNRQMDEGAVFKRGFSPIEQYVGEGKIGPWTDVYSMTATVYFAITGKVPIESVQRLKDDRIPKVVLKNQGAATRKINTVFKKGMAVKAADRLQSMKDLSESLKTAVRYNKLSGLQKSIVDSSNAISDPVGGTAGAAIGCLIGVALFVLIYQIGYISWITGLVYMLCALKGYQMLGGSLDRKGYILSVLTVIIMSFFGLYLSFAVYVYRYLCQTCPDQSVSFFYVFNHVFSYFSDAEAGYEMLGGEYAKTLLLGGVGVLSNWYTAKRRKSRAKVKKLKKRK